MAKNSSNNATIKFNYGSERMIKDAGSLSMFTALGTQDDVDSFYVWDGEQEKLATRRKPNKVSGICRLDYEMIPGISIDGASDVNISAKKLYTFVRHINSGARNYDSPDLLMYVYSVVSIYAFLAQCVRVYGIIKHYSCKNRYYGKSLIQTLGFDYDSIAKDLAGFRTFLNLQISKLNVMKVPSYWTLWNKNWYLNTALFKDGDVDKSQIYFYRMRHAWKYNEEGTYVGSLTPVDLYSEILDLDKVKTNLDSLINALVASEDINIMSGDILKAYGEDKCIDMGLIEDDFEIVPVYDRGILELIHNTDVVPITTTYTASSGFIIRQNDKNQILFQPTVNVTAFVGTGDLKVCPKCDEDYLNFFRDDVEAIDVVNASAMTVGLTTSLDVGGETATVTLDSAGTEIVTNMALFSMPNAGSNVLISSNLRRYHIHDYNGAGGTLDPSVVENELLSEVQLINNYTKFDWAPKVTMYLGTYYTEGMGGANDPCFRCIELFDLYNFTVISRADLIKLHNLHVFAAFGLAD